MKTDNELMAEFMGLQRSSNPAFFQINGEAVALDYHRSWDWLMPVVEKCNELCKQIGYPDNLELPQWHIMPVASNIKLVYFSVVEFIKWYNANK